MRIQMKFQKNLDEGGQYPPWRRLVSKYNNQWFRRVLAREKKAPGKWDVEKNATSNGPGTRFSRESLAAGACEGGKRNSRACNSIAITVTWLCESRHLHDFTPRVNCRRGCSRAKASHTCRRHLRTHIVNKIRVRLYALLSCDIFPLLRAHTGGIASDHVQHFTEAA